MLARIVRAFATVILLASAAGPPSARAPGEAASLAERLDLTRVTVLHADYTRAAARGNAAEVATYEREIVAMLQDDVLAHAGARGLAPGADDEGTGAGGASGHGAIAPGVAVDEEEVGAAALDAQVVNLCSEFVALAGKHDRASLARKGSVLGSLQAISDRAQFSSPLDRERTREGRQRAAKERRERQEFENLPVK
jgi:hypothetical protein